MAIVPNNMQPANIESLRPASIGFTCPERIGENRESYPYISTGSRNEPLFFRISGAIALNNVTASKDCTLDIAVNDSVIQGVHNVIDEMAGFYAEHSQRYFLGRSFTKEKLRDSTSAPTHQDRIRIHMSPSSVLCDRWENQVDAIQANQEVSVLVHFDKVMFAKKAIIPYFVVAGIRVLNDAVYPQPMRVVVPEEDPHEVALPDTTDSEQEFFDDT